MSPTVLRSRGYQLKIYPNDHPPAHVHVRKAEKRARVKLDPVEVMNNWGFNPREIGDIVELIKAHQGELLAQWDEIHPTSEE